MLNQEMLDKLTVEETLHHDHLNVEYWNAQADCEDLLPMDHYLKHLEASEIRAMTLKTLLDYEQELQKKYL